MNSIKKFIYGSFNLERINYRNDINGLRAIAVLSVIFYHADIKYFKGGWLGVDIFFVISGYLISNIIFSELVKGKFSFKNFYVRRIRRILPALFTVYLGSLPFTYIFLQPKATIEYISSLISSVFFISNIYFRNLDFYISEPAKLMPLIHTWSLSIEEQFYIIFPLLGFLFFKVSKKYLFFLTTFFFLFSIFLNSTNQTYDKFYFLQYRAWELLLGVLIMLIGKIQYSKFLSVCGFVLMLIPVFYFDDSWINDIEPKLLSLIGLSLFLIFNSEQSNLTKFLSLKFLSFSGLISYSLYLYHQPIFAFIRHFKLRELDSVTNLDKFLGLLFTYLLSYFSWKYIENYFLKNKNYKLLFSYLVSILIIVITFSVIGYQTNGYEKRYNYVPEEVIYYSINTNLYPSTNEIDLRYWKFYDCGFQKNYLADTVSKDSLCNKYFNKDNKKTIYLVGDSHVNYLTVSFLRELREVSNEYDLVSVGGTAGRCLISGQHDSPEYEPSCNKETFNKFIKKLGHLFVLTICHITIFKSLLIKKFYV